MKLLVRVIEARNLPALDPNGFRDSYVKLQLGKQKFKTEVIRKSLNPSWREEFTFKVDNLAEELLISVLDEDKYCSDIVGQTRVPFHQVLEAKDKSLGTNWYTLQPKNKKFIKIQKCGKILLTIGFLQNSQVADQLHAADRLLVPGKYAERPVDSPLPPLSLTEPSPSRPEEVTSSFEEKPYLPKTLANRITQLFNKNVDANPATYVEAASYASDISESVGLLDVEQRHEEHASGSSFQDLMKNLEMRDQGVEVPTALPGGVLVDQMYGWTPDQLNALLFSSDSGFINSCAETQGSTDLQVGQWKFENNGDSLKRVVSYTKAPSKLIKALKTTEEQAYIKADGKCFAVLSSALTPDAPYGKTFKVEVLYCITPGPEQPSGDQSSRLVVSWRLNFSQSSMMKSMIESGTRQGIKESFDQYKTLLSQKVKPIDLKNIASEKDQVLATLQLESQSDWKLAAQYFANYSVVSTVLMGLYLLVHIWLAMPSKSQGLEFGGLDLPDSCSEFIVSGFLFLQGKKLLELLSRFIQARARKGSDHGVKAQGNGWLLTVALIEGRSLAAVDSGGIRDPYVVFTCNGKTRTSSVKFLKSDPKWNEIFEFDAMDEPPSVLNVEVFDFDGPFDEAAPLGCAEINFLRSDISELSDVWIPLQGKLAQACQSKLHMRIFLHNNSGSNVQKDFVDKMEKEVGIKIKLRSPQANSAFQNLFKLPTEEFLINDFACHLKRKMPLKGRLFLSARIIGFHADLFGHKTKFFFLWEDIEDVKVVPPTLSSIGSPIIVMTLRPGRGLDSLHGAKSLDSESRLGYHFHTFVSFNVAHRTIMALWRARSLTPEQKVKIVEEQAEPQSVEDETRVKSLEDAGPSLQAAIENNSEAKSLHSEDSGSFLGFEDVKMSMIYSPSLSIPTSYFIELFSGGEVDRLNMERAGCLNYSHSPWESEKPEVHQRQLYYKFDKPVPPYRGEVTSIQQKTRLSDRNGWLIEEVITLHDVPFGDFFNLHLRYQVEDSGSKPIGCSVQVHIGVAWLKYTKHQKRITKNITSNFQRRIKTMLSSLEKEYLKQT